MNETRSLRAEDIELMPKADLKFWVRELLTAEDGYCKVIEAAKEREAALVKALTEIEGMASTPASLVVSSWEQIDRISKVARNALAKVKS